MRKLFYLVAGCALALAAVSCGNSGHNSAEADSIARADSIRVADSIRIADSIAKAEADSIARVDSIARADSIAKAEAKNAEANRDKSIDKDLDFIESETKLAIEIYNSGEFASSVHRHIDAAESRWKKLKSKVGQMSPQQKKRFQKLKITRSHS